MSFFGREDFVSIAGEIVNDNNVQFSPTNNGGESSFSVLEQSDIKFPHRLQSGLFKITGERVTGKYVLIPSVLLNNPNFSFDDVFAALGVNVPNLIFEINGSQDPTEWNLRLPSYRSNLIGAKKGNGALEHYYGVVSENCKRLLKGTATACEQAGAVFRIDPSFNDSEPLNYVSLWLAEQSSVPRLGLAPIEEYHPDLMNDLLANAVNYTAKARDEEDEDAELRKVVKIDIQPWVNGTKKHKHYENGGALYHTCVAQHVSHLVISDDIALLEDKLGNTE